MSRACAPRSQMGTSGEGIKVSPSAVQLFVVVEQRRLVTELIPIHSFRNGLLFETRCPARAGIVLDENRVHFAKTTTSNEFAGILVVGCAALLRANLQNAFVLAHCLHQRSAFGNAKAEWLFGVDVQAFDAGDDRRTHAHVIRRGNHDRVKLFLLEHLLIVLITRPSSTGPWIFLVVSRKDIDLRQVAIADGDQFGSMGFAGQRTRQPFGSIARADQSDSQLVIRRCGRGSVDC